MPAAVDIVLWRGTCPACAERVVASDASVCPECGLLRPREVAMMARPEAPGWLKRRSDAIAMVWLLPIALVGVAAVLGGGGAVVIALSLGALLVASAGLVVAGLMARAYRRRRARYDRRLAERHPSALAPQAAAIGTVRASLDQQITTLIGIRDRIDFAITQRDDDAAARKRLGTIRTTLETAIAARRMTMAELDAAAAD